MASRRLRVVIAELKGFTELLVKKVVFDVVANLRRAASEGGTPVLTGWARANWITTIGKPTERPVGTPENPGQALAAASAGEAQVAASYKLERGKVYISNAVGYITRLNEGSSKQAPANFVQAAIREALP